MSRIKIHSFIEFSSRDAVNSAGMGTSIPLSNAGVQATHTHTYPRATHTPVGVHVLLQT